jgi:hypothetical protein
MIKPEDLLGAQVGRKRHPTPPAQGTRKYHWRLGFFFLSALSSNTLPPAPTPGKTLKAAERHSSITAASGQSSARPIRTWGLWGRLLSRKSSPSPLSSETYRLPTDIKLAPLLISLGLLCQERGARNICFKSFPDHIYNYICKRNPKKRILFLSFSSSHQIEVEKGVKGGGRFGRFDAGTMGCCWREERVRELLSRLSLLVRAKSVNVHFAAEERK